MTTKVPIKIQPLSPAHAASIVTFTCGVKFIDAYLRQGYDLEEANFARLFIAVDAADKTQVVGYYALHMMHIEARQTPATISRNLHPAAAAPSSGSRVSRRMWALGRWFLMLSTMTPSVSTGASASTPWSATPGACTCP
jgi:hypothetical protein